MKSDKIDKDSEQCRVISDSTLKEAWARCGAIIVIRDWRIRSSWQSNELRQRPRRDSRSRASNIITELRLSDHIIILWWSVEVCRGWIYKMKRFRWQLKTSLTLLVENCWFPTFFRGTPLSLSRHTCVPRHTGWEALVSGGASPLFVAGQSQVISRIRKGSQHIDNTCTSNVSWVLTFQMLFIVSKTSTFKHVEQ